MADRDVTQDHNKRLKPVSMTGGTWQIKDFKKFNEALKLLKESLLDNGDTLFCADNLITWGRNLSFLRKERITAKIRDPERTIVEKTIIWRTYILLYFAKQALNLDGDFIECGAYEGTTAKDVLEECDLKEAGKRYWLYDLFEKEELTKERRLDGHENSDWFENIQVRFAKHTNVHIIKGSVPQSFSQGFPDCIAFCHIDMNHPDPEAGALAEILPRLVKGGSIIFDDYGWFYHSAQKIALDKVAISFGQDILELPTGQGILIKT